MGGVAHAGWRFWAYKDSDRVCASTEFEVSCKKREGAAVRITYIQQHFAMQTEPGFVRAWEFCKRLAQDGHDVTVIRGGAAPTTVVDSGVVVRTVRAPYANEMNFGRRIAAFLQFAAASTVSAVTSRPQIVVASSTPLTVVVPALIAAAINRSKFLFEVRDLWPKVPVEMGLVTNPFAIWLAENLERVSYRAARRVIALSPDMAAGVKEVSPNADVVVVPNGCDLSEFDAADPDRDKIWNDCGVPDGAVHVVYAGGFGYMYDLPWCLEYAAELHPYGIYFTFIGQGSETENLIRIAKDRGIYREGMFPGRLPKSEVIDYLKTADVILSPLRDEPSLEACSLNKVFDAMAAKKPLLLNHGGWLSRAVLQSNAGWRIPRDITDAVALTRNIVSDAAALRAAGDANRRLGEAEFDRDNQYLKFREALFN